MLALRGVCQPRADPPVGWPGLQSLHNTHLAPPLPPQISGKKLELATAELAAHAIVKRIADAERSSQLSADLANISDTALTVVKVCYLPMSVWVSLSGRMARLPSWSHAKPNRCLQEGAQEELVALRTRLVATEAALNGSRAAHAAAVQRAAADLDAYKARIGVAFARASHLWLKRLPFPR